MQTASFTPAQLHVLHLMSYMKSENDYEELDKVITDYFAKRDDCFVKCPEIPAEMIYTWIDDVKEEDRLGLTLSSKDVEARLKSHFGWN